jgi:transposase-like protein
LIAGQLYPKVPKLVSLMDAAQEDTLAFMDFPREHRAKLHNTNPIERTTVRSSAAPMWPASFPMKQRSSNSSALCFSNSPTNAPQRSRYTTPETTVAVSDTAPVSLPAAAA